MYGDTKMMAFKSWQQKLKYISFYKPSRFYAKSENLYRRWVL